MASINNRVDDLVNECVQPIINKINAIAYRSNMQRHSDFEERTSFATYLLGDNRREEVLSCSCEEDTNNNKDRPLPVLSKRNRKMVSDL